MVALICPIKNMAQSAMIINTALEIDLENNDFMEIYKG